MKCPLLNFTKKTTSLGILTIYNAAHKYIIEICMCQAVSSIQRLPLIPIMGILKLKQTRTELRCETYN
jgi:hypothetical protein